MKNISTHAAIQVCALLFSGLVFLLYANTSYQTVSFWDSGEFLISAATLQIPHAPGAPLYALLGRFLAIFAGDNPEQIVYNIHALSWLGGSVTVYFLFLFAVEIARKMLDEMEYVSKDLHTFIAVMSGLIGTAILAFSDTFWRLSTEAEVYTLAAACFSASLYYTWKFNVSGNIRFLFVSVFILGLGATAHLTVLLLWPVIIWSLVVRKWNYSLSKLPRLLLVTIVVSGILILWVTQILPEIFVVMDVLIVNEFGWAQQAGIGILLAYILVLILSVVGCLTTKHKWMFFSVFIFHLGLSAYALIPIRAAANVPFNMGMGQDAESFRHYLMREDFGLSPLISGYDFTNKNRGSSLQRIEWNDNQKRYIYYSASIDNTQQSEDVKRMFPRMYHPDYAGEYIDWLYTHKAIDTSNHKSGVKPRLQDHLLFFLDYQFGYQYLRYLGWNLIGRKHDAHNSPVVTGVGYRTDHPAVKYPPGRAPYYMLPLILSICGLLSLMLFSGTGFRFWLFWFCMTGPILVVLINMTPAQVRERDYIFQLSLMGACWIGGMSFPMIAGWILHYFRKEWVYAISPIILAVPFFQFLSGYNSHNVKANTMAYDFAKLTLDACPLNAILFTGGDNDAFPIWCLQYVYGIRKDVVVLNINLLDKKWYLKSLSNTEPKFKAIPEIQFQASMEEMSHDAQKNKDHASHEFKYMEQPKGKSIMKSILKSYRSGNLPYPICYTSLLEKGYIRKFESNFHALGMVNQLMKDDTTDFRPRSSTYFLSRFKQRITPKDAYLNFTERSFKWKLSNVFLEMGGQERDNGYLLRKILHKMDTMLPVDVLHEPTRIVAQRGLLWLYAGDAPRAIQNWAIAAYRSHGLQCWYKYNGWADILQNECSDYHQLEHNVKQCSPSLLLNSNWLQPSCGEPCFGMRLR